MSRAVAAKTTRILSAALREPRSGLVMSRRWDDHCNLLGSLESMGVTRLLGYHLEQGFLTSDGLFVDPKEALKIAEAAGQVQSKYGKDRDYLWIGDMR